jgi:hypothetical protein
VACAAVDALAACTVHPDEIASVLSGAQRSMCAMTDLVATWRLLTQARPWSWVVFEHGTWVGFADPAPDADLAAEAVELLREYGPMCPGTTAGDFGTITLDSGLGFLVSGHHDAVLTFVGPDELSVTDALSVGLHGRAMRDLDGRELRVIHVEDNRPSPGP